MQPATTVNLLNELDRHPNSMPSLQLLLLFVFVACYVAAMSGFFGERGRLRAALTAVLAAVCICVVFRPWTVGVMLIAAVVVGVGLFIAFTLVVSRLIGVSTATAPLEPAPAPARTPSRGTPGLPPQATPARVG